MFRIIIILFIITSFGIYSQQSKLSKGVNYITEYIASDHFQELRKSNNDLALVDSIFLRAVSFYDNNVTEALLALTFATVPYKIVPIKIPVLNFTVGYPLVSHYDSLFLKKNERLPSKLFYHTPLNNYGDRDKLAHFFGSAYISYQSNIFDLGNLIGYFIEVFEESFKVQSEIDLRDLETNKLGNIFGEVLKKNSQALPSGILLVPTIKMFNYNL